MNKMLTPGDGLNYLASLITILTAFATITIQIVTITNIPDPPKDFDFFILFFWAIIAAFLGGLPYNILVMIRNSKEDKEDQVLDDELTERDKKDQVLGGEDNEPKGLYAALWGFLTNLPTVLILIFLNISYDFLVIQHQFLLSTGFLLGVTVGSAVFYDSALNANKGIRKRFDKEAIPSFVKREIYLAFIWSAFLSLGFLFLAIARFVYIPGPINVGFSLLIVLLQTVFCIMLTTTSVASFVFLFPSYKRYETARGIVAGLFLRIGLFLGLLLGLLHS